jgi:hypothetical protein
MSGVIKHKEYGLLTEYLLGERVGVVPGNTEMSA